MMDAAVAGKDLTLVHADARAKTLRRLRSAITLQGLTQISAITVLVLLAASSPR